MLWTAFLLGLFGGMHCAGMCGPIALAIPNRKGTITNVLNKVFYNSGRVITYSVLGIFTGLIGYGLNIAGLQQALSISLGIFLIIIILTTGANNLNIPPFKPVAAVGNTVKKYFSHFLKKRSHLSVLGLGILNGLLPCGLVYVALAASLAGGSIQSSALYMLIFGLGTFPVMLILSLAGNVISSDLRLRIYKVVPIFVIALGLLFILRGLNLGIPYISPEIGGFDEIDHQMNNH